ncbi:thioesterase domain-containing protein [Acidiphilium sp. PA]|uniref:thioesterase domain-containing protein n=1 Tax=Acidiphilium sp. PA TaxID=2871705 RepID=UPI002242E3D0|nr:alpha/beta fold hydrolase [Acidiphilium sp. PA]MCW8307851.1 thioesterase domain-containing protein [Acidiphilium sp. PA]
MAVITPLWRREFGRKGQDVSAHVLHISVGIGRITRFIDAVEAELGVRIPPTALMRLGTMTALSAAIAHGAFPPASPLVLLRAGRQDAALYVVAAGTGLVLELCELAAGIDFAGQIWALQLPGLDGEAAPLTSIPAMARLYADAIRTRHAGSGAINLIGYSFGGLVCVELARLLVDAALPIGLVGLIDSACYEKYWPRSEWVRVACRRAARRLGEMRQMTPPAALRHLMSRAAALGRHFGRRLNPAAGAASFTQSAYYVSGLEPNLQRVRDASIIAYESYDPAPIDQAIVLFKSQHGDQHGCDPVRIWQRLARSLQIVPVPGSHITMLRKPCVQVLARRISDRLQ